MEINMLIQSNISLKDKNWFYTGGNAKYYSEPTNIQEFINSINFAKQEKQNIFILGQGANILISDNGFNGLVIKPRMQKIYYTPQNSLNNINNINNLENYILVTAESGTIFQDLIDWCIENNLSGLEEFSGIPGTVGGSVYINIHYFEFLLGQFLISAEILDKETGKTIILDNNNLNFGYNKSILQDKNYYLLNATFKLKKISTLQSAYIKGKRDEIIRHRLKRYPKTGTCGSFFRNFYDYEVTLESAGQKIIYAAYYLDKIGIKGVLKAGNAIVSHQHANMIVNTGNAITEDIIQVARIMQEKVKDNFGITLQPECRLVGFDKYPLIK